MNAPALDIDAPVIPRRHIGRWVAVLVIAAAIAGLISLLSGATISWSEIPGFFLSPLLLEGLWGTIVLTASTMALGFALGVVLAVMRQSKNPIISGVSATYVWLFRAVPALLQVILWFNMGLVIKMIDIPGIYSGPTSDLITPFTAALLGLGLSEAAYMAEIIRGGILAIDKGQTEAALSVGMSPLGAMGRIVLPQALRLIIPPTGNEVISMMKYTSIAFAVAYSELLSQASKIYSNNFKVMEVLLAAAAWYLILTAVLTLGQRWLERRLDISARERRIAVAEVV